MALFSDNKTSQHKQKISQHKQKTSHEEVLHEDLLIEYSGNEFESHSKKYINFYSIVAAIFLAITIATISIIPSFLSKKHTKVMGAYNSHASPNMRADITETNVNKNNKKREVEEFKKVEEEIKTIKATYN